MTWEEWYALYDENPEALTGDIHEGFEAIYGSSTMCDLSCGQGNPRAVGVAGPNLTYLAERHSIAAVRLNHRNDDNTVDSKAELDNFIKWIKHTDEVNEAISCGKPRVFGIGELIC